MGWHRIAPHPHGPMTINAQESQQKPKQKLKRPADAATNARRKDTLGYKLLVRPKKWIAQVCALPVAVIWFPVSCCFRNPAVAMAREDGAVFDQFGPSERAQDNIINGCIVGALSTVTLGCCCCGCFCDFDPDEL